jgi:hypothetical protein
MREPASCARAAETVRHVGTGFLIASNGKKDSEPVVSAESPYKTVVIAMSNPTYSAMESDYLLLIYALL